MKNKLIVVADLGLLRIYREDEAPPGRAPRLELVTEVRPEGSHEKLSDQLSDGAGRFPQGGGAAHVPGSLSSGERLHIGEERLRKIIATLADRINAALKDDEVASCKLAASAPIHKRLVDLIAPEARAKIRKIVPSDFTGVSPASLSARFDGKGT